VFIFALIFLLVACGGAASTPTAAPPPTNESSQVATATSDTDAEATTEATNEATNEATLESTAEATTESTAEATLEETTEATSEATTEATLEATREVAAAPTTEATDAATREVAAAPTVEATREATTEATSEAEATSESTQESLAPTFHIQLTGDIEATFDQDNGLYGYGSFQEAETTETPTATPPSATETPLSMYSMRFTNENGDYQIVIGFSAVPPEGTYTVGKEIVVLGAESTAEATEDNTPEATAESTSEPLFIVVHITLVDGDTTYDQVQDGTLTIDNVDEDNGVHTGHFTFQVGTTDDPAANVTVEGEFANLALIRTA
jgi:hypothetical protein